MGFVQIIEFRTSKLDDMERVGSEWEAAAGADRKARRRVLCKDRDSDDRYFNVVFFDSYEEAMENSEMDETQQFSRKLNELVDGQPTYFDLDIVEDRAL